MPQRLKTPCRHPGCPRLSRARFCDEHTKDNKRPADNWKPSKKKSVERIDGIVALIMALGRATTQPPPFRSVYETRVVEID